MNPVVLFEALKIVILGQTRLNARQKKIKKQFVDLTNQDGGLVGINIINTPIDNTCFISPFINNR